MDVYPYKLSPLYKAKIWGGRNLERLFGRSLPAVHDIGESWELADLEEGQCSIVNGARAGQSMRQLLVEQGEDVLGRSHAPEGRFPLLLKLLDANDTLSLQVHPDEQAVRAIPGAALKTECWYVLESRNGFIYKGLKEGVTAEHFRSALDSDNVTDLLERFEVKAGDFHYLPAGTVHALGAGVVVAEVQTPSDTTYRVSDWGRGREIHVERAMQCIHFSERLNGIPGASGDCLLKTPYFNVYRRVLQPGTTALPEGQCVCLMVLAGEAKIRCASRDGMVNFGAGDTMLLPAAMREGTVTVFEPLEYIEVHLPPFGDAAGTGI